MAQPQVFINITPSNGYFLSDASVGDLSFYTSSSNQRFLFGVSNNPAVMAITSSNISMTKPVDVAGDINFTGILRQGGLPYVGSQWSNNSSNVFILNSNIGIGKSNPTTTLDVEGDINFTGNLTKAGVPFVSGGGGGGAGWSNTGSNLVIFGSNVGIGLSNPQAQLHVACNVQIGGSLMMQNALAMPSLVLRIGGNTANTTSVTTLTSNIAQLGFSNFGSNVVNISCSNGLLGIGTDTPQAQLHVACNLQVGGSLMMQNSLTMPGIELNIGGNTLNTTSVTTLTSNVAQLGFSNFGSNVVNISCSNGLLGIGTSTPQAQLHVASNVQVDGTILMQSTPVMPGIALSIGGNVVNTSSLSSNFTQITFSNYGTSTASISCSNGNLGVNTAAPMASLHVYKNDTTTTQIMIENDATSIGKAGINFATNNNLYNVYTQLDTAGVFSIVNQSATGVALAAGGNSWASTSDKRLKENIQPLEWASSKIQLLNPVTYDWKATHTPGVGFIAQEVEQVIPGVVELPSTEEGFYSLRTGDIVPYLVKAFQEQQALIDTLQNRLALIESATKSI